MKLKSLENKSKTTSAGKSLKKYDFKTLKQNGFKVEVPASTQKQDKDVKGA